ncbi:MAG: hypothetical protein JWR64_1393 [Marmoricola sp.]|nr:hypothetical protein [Marmoricola sp.]
MWRHSTTSAHRSNRSRFARPALEGDVSRTRGTANGIACQVGPPTGRVPVHRLLTRHTQGGA